MHKRRYLPLVLAATLAPLAVNANGISEDDIDPHACLGKDGIKNDKTPDLGGPPDETPPDYAGKPADTPPDYSGKPDETPPDYAGKPDDYFPPDKGGKPDEYPPTPGAVPIPAAAWLLGSGLLGMVGIARGRRRD